MKAVPLADGFEEILFPGELEHRNGRPSDELGVELPSKTRSDLAVLADESGVQPPL